MTMCDDITTLDLNGMRNGAKVVVARAVILEDAFARRELLPRKWYLNTMGYALTTISVPGGHGKNLRLHRMVYQHYYGAVPEGKVIDHEDRNPMNCLPWNLRTITQSENCANSGKNRSNVSGYKGVSWHAGGGKWQANITVNWKAMGLGLFVDVKDAARAVNAAYRKYFPNVAVPNPEVEGV